MTDTDALKERIARVLYAQIWLDPDAHPFDPHSDEGRGARVDAAAVLPIIREAQADALRGAAGSMNDDLDAGYLYECAALLDQESTR